MMNGGLMMLARSSQDGKSRHSRANSWLLPSTALDAAFDDRHDLYGRGHQFFDEVIAMMLHAGVDQAAIDLVQYVGFGVEVANGDRLGIDLSQAKVIVPRGFRGDSGAVLTTIPLREFVQLHSTTRRRLPPSRLIPSRSGLYHGDMRLS